jgi:hypothetical protein
MLFRTLLTVGLLGSLAPLTSQAQDAPASPRFYVGVGANLLSNVPFKSYGIVPRLIGPSLTAGMQFTPRLAGQVGLSYHRKKDSYTYENAGPAGTTEVIATYRSQYFIIPVLLRYTVTNPAERFHFDVLGGATLLVARASGAFEFNGVVDPSLVTQNSNYNFSNARFNLTLGPAVRTAVSPRLELTASSLASVSTGTYYKFSDRLFLNTSLGINYAFGQR